MDNLAISDALGELADLLELQNANPFRVRAYRTAVRTIGNLTRPLSDMVTAGEDLRELPGIGEDISGYIEELVRTGKLRMLARQRAKVPASLTTLMRIEGVGPRKARTLYQKLGVRTLAQLRRAIESGRVEEVRGFGEKSAQKILAGIGELEKREVRFKLSDADQIVQPLLDYMRADDAVELVEPAGSYRRRRETVGDLDLLVISAHPAHVVERFTSYPEVKRVDAAGDTRATVVLQSRLQVDLRVVPAASYGAALHYFTGSKAHNIAVRKLGVAHGLKINEYGVFRGKRRIRGATEAEVFGAVGLDWIAPELREDRGEIAAAGQGTLPRLIELKHMRGDLQMHTDWSDGTDSMEAMARACKALGYEYMAFTDHTASVAVTGGLTTRQLEQQWREISTLRRRVRGIHIFRGMEVDILKDGSLDLPQDYLSELDVVVASVHSSLRMAGPAMTERVIKAIANPAVDILAHATGRLINRRAGSDIDLEEVLQAASRFGVAVEINAQPDRLDINDVWARRACELGVKLVINTDAHSADTLRFMKYGVDQARRGWVEKQHVINTMPLAGLTKWLHRRRPRVALQPA